MSKNVKENCVNALVRPILDYSCTAWDPYWKYQIEKLELLNKMAARFITGNYTMECGNTNRNMKALGWTPLENRREKIKLSMLFKIISHSIHVPRDDLVPNPRKPLNFILPYSSVDSHLHSFFPSTIRLWNSIPQHAKSCDSLSSFKAALNKITINRIH